MADKSRENHRHGERKGTDAGDQLQTKNAVSIPLRIGKDCPGLPHAGSCLRQEPPAANAHFG